MPYKLRFVQKFIPSKREAFLELEKEFIKLEEETEGFPKGKRYLPYSGRESTNTLIWESEFESLEEAQKALDLISNHPNHETLYQKQVPFFQDAYTEIYQSF
ncbi:MAG: hypothetical protein COA79_23895 [Planctomycetota bacterium]|nr:MAG: hypothetical protein COA79_23895 [Planctomycetota bacterium]